MILNETLVHPTVISPHAMQLQPVREFGEQRSKVRQLGYFSKDVCLEAGGLRLGGTVWHAAEEGCGPGGQVYA